MPPALGQATQQARETQVSIQMGRMNDARESLRECIARLEQRLQPILRDTGPETPALRDNAKPEARMVGLAEALANSVSELQHFTGWVSAITERLEI